MSHNEDRSMSVSLFDEHPPTSSCSSKGFNDGKCSTPKEVNENKVKESPTAPSTELNQKKVENLEIKIDSFEILRRVFTVIILLSGACSMILFWKAGKLFGIPFYSILLFIHAFSFLGLFFVHYHILPPLIDELSITSYQLSAEEYYIPAYHPSSNEKFWCYLRILLAILIDTGIWIYLWYMDFQIKNSLENSDEVLICMSLGALLFLFSFFVMVKLGPLAVESKVEEQNTKQGNDDIEQRKLNSQIYAIMRVEDELKLQKMEEIIKLRRQMSDKEASYTKLLKENETILLELKERDKECEKLRKELS